MEKNKKCKKGYKKINGKCVKQFKDAIIIPASNKFQTGGGIGFLSLLALLFIGLKLAHVIDWSWGWVLAPLWIPVMLSIVIASIFFIIFWRRT